MLLSGDREGVTCGTDPSNSSARNSVENVRLASSAASWSALVSDLDRVNHRREGEMGLLFWKWSSPCGVLFLCLDGVAGEASSCRRLKLACRSWPVRVGMKLDTAVSFQTMPSVAAGINQPITVDPLAFAMRAGARCALTLGALQLPQQCIVDGVDVKSGGVDIARPCPASKLPHRAAVALDIGLGV